MNIVLVQRSEQPAQCRVPQHRERRSPQNALPPRIQITLAQCFETERRALARTNRPGEAFEPCAHPVKSRLGRKTALCPAERFGRNVAVLSRRSLAVRHPAHEATWR